MQFSSMKVKRKSTEYSCFFYADNQRYAEMDKNEKNKISHRGKALEKLKDWLLQES